MQPGDPCPPGVCLWYFSKATLERTLEIIDILISYRYTSYLTQFDDAQSLPRCLFSAVIVSCATEATPPHVADHSYQHMHDL